MKKFLLLMWVLLLGISIQAQTTKETVSPPLPMKHSIPISTEAWLQ